MNLCPHSSGEWRHPTKSEERSAWHHPGLHQIKTSTKTCKMSFMVRNKGKKVYVYALFARTIILPIVGPVSSLFGSIHHYSSDFIFIMAVFFYFIFIMAVFLISFLSWLYCFVLITFLLSIWDHGSKKKLFKFVNGSYYHVCF